MNFLKGKARRIIYVLPLVFISFELYFLWQNALPFRAEMNASPVGRLRRPEGENINPVISHKIFNYSCKIAQVFLVVREEPWLLGRGISIF